ncbi:hypothetical protein GQ55_1G045600 [Panicum hallii var. hallii]|uniref:Uncharacterized protein n=1 Tax=Panicum hallii var. hallii TaxID=1504633 RepID=A0A2T7F282_9POAL|nr:hypothetical protein GQ55_1G045600 [Panicum hallii var. hallii]
MPSCSKKLAAETIRWCLPTIFACAVFFSSLFKFGGLFHSKRLLSHDQLGLERHGHTKITT